MEAPPIQNRPHTFQDFGYPPPTKPTKKQTKRKNTKHNNKVTTYTPAPVQGSNLHCGPQQVATYTAAPAQAPSRTQAPKNQNRPPAQAPNNNTSTLNNTGPQCGQYGLSPTTRKQHKTTKQTNTQKQHTNRKHTHLKHIFYTHKKSETTVISESNFRFARGGAKTNCK